MKKTILGACLVAVTLTLSGCYVSGMEQDRSTDSLREETITLNDGRTIVCVIYASGYKGGLSCDWGD